MRVEVMEMAKKWTIVSDYVSRERIEFESKEELLRALEELGWDTELLEEADGVLRTRVYSDRDRGLVIEARDIDFDRRTWIRNPDWLVIAEVQEDEQE